SRLGVCDLLVLVEVEPACRNRTDDLFITRSCRACLLPAAAQLTPHVVSPPVPAVDRRSAYILARMWHAHGGSITGKMPAPRPQHRGGGPPPGAKETQPTTTRREGRPKRPH